VNAPSRPVEVLLAELRGSLRGMGWRRRRRLLAEARAHLDDLVDDAMRGGLPRREAERVAAERFGSAGRLVESLPRPRPRVRAPAILIALAGVLALLAYAAVSVQDAPTTREALAPPETAGPSGVRLAGRAPASDSLPAKLRAALARSPEKGGIDMRPADGPPRALLQVAVGRNSVTITSRYLTRDGHLCRLHYAIDTPGHAYTGGAGCIPAGAAAPALDVTVVGGRGLGLQEKESLILGTVLSRARTLKIGSARVDLSDQPVIEGRRVLGVLARISDQSMPPLSALDRAGQTVASVP
jgi:hypothetical protein